MAEDKELTKLHRIFRLIDLMSRPYRRTTKEYAAKLGVGRKTIERYYKLLEKIGYYVDSDAEHRYFIQIESGLADKLDFEEAAYLNDLLQQLPDDRPERMSLLLKVNQQYQLYPVLQTVQRGTDFRKVQQLQRALKKGLVIKIYNYAGGDGSVTNRRVVLTDFTQDLKSVLAFDLDKQGPRQFHIERMGNIEVTAEAAEVAAAFTPNDLFGWPGENWFSLRLELTDRAAQLLREEFPLSRTMVSRQRNGKWLADLHIHGLPAAARFIRGLPHDIEILPGGVAEEMRELLNDGQRVW